MLLQATLGSVSRDANISITICDKKTERLTAEGSVLTEVLSDPPISITPRYASGTPLMNNLWPLTFAFLRSFSSIRFGSRKGKGRYFGWWRWSWVNIIVVVDESTYFNPAFYDKPKVCFEVEKMVSDYFTLWGRRTLTSLIWNCYASSDARENSFHRWALR